MPIDNPPAFPCYVAREELSQNDNYRTVLDSLGGMSLRDYFAAAAMQGLLADLETRMSAGKHARMAYEYADAMLAARAKVAPEGGT